MRHVGRDGLGISRRPRSAGYAPGGAVSRITTVAKSWHLHPSWHLRSSADWKPRICLRNRGDLGMRTDFVYWALYALITVLLALALFARVLHRLIG